MAQRSAFGTVVGYMHHCGAELLKKAADIAQQLVVQLIVKAVEWLVKQHDVRPTSQSAGKRNTLGLTPRQTRRATMLKAA